MPFCFKPGLKKKTINSHEFSRRRIYENFKPFLTAFTMGCFREKLKYFQGYDTQGLIFNI